MLAGAFQARGPSARPTKPPVDSAENHLRRHGPMFAELLAREDVPWR